MFFTEYAKQAYTTASQRHDKTMRLLNWTLGLVTETEEIQESLMSTLSSEALEDELGDLFWYIAAYYMEFKQVYGGHVDIDADFTDLEALAAEAQAVDAVFNLWQAVSVLASLQKCEVFHPEKWKRKGYGTLDYLVGIRKVYMAAVEIGIVYDLDIQKVWQSNLKKLNVRHGDGFSGN